MTLSATRRTSLVLSMALALFAGTALLSISAGLVAPAAATQEDGDDDAGGLLDGVAPEDEDDDAAEGADDGLGDDAGLADDGLEDDGLGDDGLGDDGLGDDGLEDDGADEATPVGGVDAGFGGLTTDGANGTAIAIALATVLLAIGGGVWAQRRQATDPA